jgi:hypothetical protein
MTNQQPHYAVLTIATHPSVTPAGGSGIITGFGLLIVTELAQTSGKFKLYTGVVDKLSDEEQLMLELADVLPHPVNLLGNQINAHIVALEQAAERQTPIVAAYLRQRLARIEAAVRMDLAPPSLSPRGPILRADDNRVVINVSGETILDTETAYRDLEQRVIDDWMRFLSPSVVSLAQRDRYYSGGRADGAERRDN